MAKCDYLASSDVELEIPLGFQSRRWWPEEGSRALRLIWRSSLQVIAGSIKWCGRAGSISFKTGWVQRRRTNSFVTVAIFHGSHADLEDSLRDLS